MFGQVIGPRSKGSIKGHIPDTQLARARYGALSWSRRVTVVGRGLNAGPEIIRPVPLFGSPAEGSRMEGAS